MECLELMPKIELHAHLNGSIRSSTLLELAGEMAKRETPAFSDVENVIVKHNRSLGEVFKMFDLIHIVTTDHKAVTRITKEVIEDFAAENVVYLELRTTPKRNDLKGMSKRSYMQAVLEGISAVSAVKVDISHELVAETTVTETCGRTGKKKIFVRLLLSIDRRETTEAAMETVNVALEMRRFGVVGIDLSGNPMVGEWSTFLPALEFAKMQGLAITLHCGEVYNSKEIHAMLDFLPNRIGHACCFEEEEWKKLKKSKIPVEICLTSNIKTETISSVDVHHFADLYKSNHPLILCTDDAGVFSTSLSAEYLLTSSAFGLGEKELFELARKGIEFVFAGNEVKQKLQEIFARAGREMDL